MAKTDSYYKLGLILGPFIVLVLAYFHYTTAGEPTILMAILKIAPILWLITIIYYINGLKNSYETNIFYGLITAIIGDVFLVWQNTYFGKIFGVIAFSLTHYFYANAIGFEPFKQELILQYCLPIAVGNYLFMFNHLNGKYSSDYCLISSLGKNYAKVHLKCDTKNR
jgi:hypothetical protein